MYAIVFIIMCYQSLNSAKPLKAEKKSSRIFNLLCVFIDALRTLASESPATL